MNAKQDGFNTSIDSPVSLESACASMAGNGFASGIMAYIAWVLVSVVIGYLMITVRGIMTLGLGQMLDHDTSVIIARYTYLVLTSIFIVRMTNYEWFDYYWTTDSNGFTIHRPFHSVVISWDTITSVKLIRGDCYLEIKLLPEDSPLQDSTVASRNWLLEALLTVFGYGKPKKVRVNLANTSNRTLPMSLLAHLRYHGKAEGIRYANGALATASNNERDTAEFDNFSDWYVAVTRVPHIKALESVGTLYELRSRLAVMVIPGLVIGVLFTQIWLACDGRASQAYIAFIIGYLITVLTVNFVWMRMKVDGQGIHLQTALVDKDIPWQSIRSLSLIPEQMSPYMELVLDNSKHIRRQVDSPRMELSVCMYALEYNKATELMISEHARSIYTPIPDDIPDEITWTVSWMGESFTVDAQGIKQSKECNSDILWKDIDDVFFSMAFMETVSLEISAGGEILEFYFDVMNANDSILTPEIIAEAEIHRLSLLSIIKHIRKEKPGIPVWFSLVMLKPAEEIMQLSQQYAH